MKAKVLGLVMGVLLTGATVISAQAAAHVHQFDEPVYLRTEQDGSYTHSYLYGYDRYENPIYKQCTVLCEIEYYTSRCTVNGCDETYGEYSEYVESHTHCSQ